MRFYRKRDLATVRDMRQGQKTEVKSEKGKCERRMSKSCIYRSMQFPLLTPTYVI